MKRWLISTVLGAALASGAFAQSAISSGTLALKDVRAGQRGVGRTVFSGSKVEEFQVEILGVLENIGPKQNIILGRLSGGPLANTGVMQGMSGSPVWVDGKLIGAVALAFPFAKEPIAGIRPIDEMLAQPAISTPVVRADANRLEAKFGESRLVEVATPVSFSGFTARTIEHFAPQWRKMGLEPLQGIGGQASAASRGSSNNRLEPGSMISVQLVSGDLSVGADGTVTHIDGDKIYAFGHRFLSTGTSEMPFTRSEVIALLPNLASSFKISAGRDWLGTITQDGNAAIAGVIGKRAPMIPVSIAIDGSSRRTSYRAEMIQSATLSPFLLQMILFSALDGTERTLGSSTISVRGEIALEGGLPPLKIDQVFSGDFNTPVVATLGAVAPLTYLMQSSAEVPRIRSISITSGAVETRKIWQIEQVSVSKREARPGEELDITVALAGEGDRMDVRKLKYQVPIGAPPGQLQVTVADATTTNLAENRSLLMLGARPPKQLVNILNSLRGNSSAYLRVWRQDSAYTMAGVDYANLPAGLSMLLARAQQTGTLTAQGTKLAEMEIGLKDAVVSGSKTIQVEVKE